MKNKMKYLYGGLFVFIVFAIWLSTRNEKSSDSDAELHKTINISDNARMPKDEIHNKLNTTKPVPSKNNVTKGFIHEMEMLKKQITKVPDDTVSIKKYAQLLSASHKQSEAIDYYKRILTIDKKRKDILLDLTFVFYNMRDLKNAEFYTQQLLKYYPDNLAGQYNLGAIYASNGNKNKASDIWNKIITNFPNSEQAKLAKSSLVRLNK